MAEQLDKIFNAKSEPASRSNRYPIVACSESHNGFKSSSSNACDLQLESIRNALFKYCFAESNQFACSLFWSYLNYRKSISEVLSNSICLQKNPAFKPYPRKD
jgi:hypothetical protein